jgi:transposase-like protein
MEDQRERPDQGQSEQSGVDRQHRRYRKFDEEFKQEAVRLSELPGKTLASVARSLGIDVNTLGLWRKRYGAGVKPKPVGRPQGDQAADAAIDPAVVAMQLELMEVRKRLREAETERDILKKAMAVFARHQP